ncbi:MAG: A/G-specific adenine glycosylase [Phycisphaerales bacterium JB038]
MAQQTQISRVAERYVTFLEAFPSVGALARADEAEVLALWSGLGYYNRARHLHRAAQQIVAEHGGEVPGEPRLLRRLPGVGPYTAGAIASIAFGLPEPIVDGNVARVLIRLAAREEAPDESACVKWCWQRAGELVRAAKDPAAFNEGLMELGATVCTPSAPSCAGCPLAGRCQARAQNLQEELPRAKRPPRRRPLYCASLLCTRNGAVLLEQRGNCGMWASLWQAPTLESDKRLGPAALRRAHPALRSTRKVHSFTHQTSHRQVEFAVYRASPEELTKGTGRWVKWTDLGRYAVSRAQQRVLECAGGDEESRPSAR